ncbi:MAG: DUF935 family protein [Verrucomicrobiota bacterium]
MSSRKRSQLPQDGLGGFKTRTPGVRRGSQAIKGGLKGTESPVRLANRAGQQEVGFPAAVSMAKTIASANRFREQYDPLRGMTIRRARTLVNDYNQGIFAELQWAYFNLERDDETLSALATRRHSAIAKLDWNIKVTPEKDLPPGATSDQAEAQRLALRAAYDRITNLREAIDHLALATFRGFAHLEKVDVDGDGQVDTLLPVDQWNVVRDGIRGAWYYNPRGWRTNAQALGENLQMDPSRFVVREVHRHVDWVALFCFVRKKLSQKDWDGFVEGYGLNPTIVIGPPGVPPTKEKEYAASAQTVSEHGGGYLPNGSTVEYANKEKGQTPFKEHIDEQKANVVLVGTGGKLTMLNGPTGLGSGQSQSHEDTFAEIACAEAMEISAILQDQFDRAVLSVAFPGQPVLAWFELAADEEADPNGVVQDVKTLSDAGFQVDPEEVTEKSGYTVTPKAAPAPTLPPGQAPGGPAADPQSGDPETDLQGGTVPPLVNRAIRNSARQAALSGDTDTLRLINTARDQLVTATAQEMAPLRERIDALENIRDQGEWRQAAERLVQEISDQGSELRQSLGRVSASADVLAGAMGAALVNGMAAGAPKISAGRSLKTRSVARPASAGNR